MCASEASPTVYTLFSVKLLQIHSAVQARHLIRIAVENDSRSCENLTQSPLPRLAPTWMVDVRIHIRIETVLAGRVAVPCHRWLRFLKAYFDDRLDALVAVFPRDDHTHGRAVLRWERLAIHSKTQQRQRIHRFVEAQSLHIRQIDARVLCFRHLACVKVRLECNILRLRRQLKTLDERAQRIANPR